MFAVDSNFWVITFFGLHVQAQHGALSLVPHACYMLRPMQCARTCIDCCAGRLWHSPPPPPLFCLYCSPVSLSCPVPP